MTLIKYNREDWLTLLMLKSISMTTLGKTKNKYNRIYKKYLKNYKKAA